MTNYWLRFFFSGFAIASSTARQGSFHSEVDAGVLGCLVSWQLGPRAIGNGRAGGGISSAQSRVRTQYHQLPTYLSSENDLSHIIKMFMDICGTPNNT